MKPFSLRLLPSVAALALAFALSPTASLRAEDAKAAKIDPAGTWVWSTPGQNGQTRESTLKLKFDGDKLVGTLKGRGAETEISEAKFKGEELTFVVAREVNGAKVVQKYAGKVGADTIKGKIEFQREGQAQTRDWEAKREVKKEGAK